MMLNLVPPGLSSQIMVHETITGTVIGTTGIMVVETTLVLVPRLLVFWKCLPHPSEWVVVPVSPSVPPHATLPNPTLPSATEASSSPHVAPIWTY
ncbi:hypothetical protein GBA52_005064 [Prunus armeniaca]|nr:hypothetical protein GBA52_005064 [Prunus armeniaca]